MDDKWTEATKSETRNRLEKLFQAFKDDIDYLPIMGWDDNENDLVMKAHIFLLLKEFQKKVIESESSKI